MVWFCQKINGVLVEDGIKSMASGRTRWDLALGVWMPIFGLSFSSQLALALTLPLPLALSGPRGHQC